MTLASMLQPPRFPPLFTGEAVDARIDPFQKALASVLSESEPGLLVWSRAEDAMRAAVVFAPEMPLRLAMGVLFAAELGFADALGALAPPEVAVHFRWPDAIAVNGALCGRLRAAASTQDPEAEPDWLVVGIDVPILAKGGEPGMRPSETTLADEGCVKIAATELVEAYSRHMLVWTNTFLSEGFAPLLRSWTAKCDTLGKEVERPEQGLFLGLDERGGMLLRQVDATKILPLTVILDPAWPNSLA